MFEELFDTVFDQQELTAHINTFPILYGRIGEMNLFRPRTVATTEVRLDLTANRLTLLPASERGADGAPVRKRADSVKYLTIPHIPHKGSVTPEDVQNRRKPGTDELETVEDAVLDEIESMRRNHDITRELMLMSALKGELIDGDGTVLYNYFTEFGIVKRTINFELDTPGTDVRAKIRELIRETEFAMIGDTMTGVRVPCDSVFMDKLTGHANVEKFYLNHQQSVQHAEEDLRVFPFAGAVFEEYNGRAPKADGTLQKFIDEGKGHAFPTGTNNTFFEIGGPAHAMSQANRAPSSPEGEEGGLFVTAELLKHDAGVEMQSQANRLMLCQQPLVLTELVAA